MCGRYVAPTDLAQLSQVFELANLPENDLGVNYNVSPSQAVYAIFVDHAGSRQAHTMQWGLTAAWDSKQKIANARSETVDTKSSFKELFLKNRCLVPMQGYYEWFRPADVAKTKQPFFIYSQQMKLLPVAGIYRDNEVTILTTSANKKLSRIHDRMPVLVPPKNWVNWLSTSVQSAHSIKELIPQVPDELLVAHPVGVEVNNSRSQGKELIAPIGSLVATEDIYRINHEDFSFEEFSNE